jgi:hypothetical protein
MAITTQLYSMESMEVTVTRTFKNLSSPIIIDKYT